MRGISLTWLLGLPVLTLLAWTGWRREWSPQPLWQLLLPVLTVLTLAYLMRVLYIVATIP